MLNGYNTFHLCSVLEDDEFYIDLADYDDSRFPEKKEKDPEIEEFLKTLAQGKQIPHASTWNKNLLPPEDADSFMKYVLYDSQV